MANSNQGYGVVLARFDNACQLVQGWGDYNPTNSLISKTELSKFIGDVNTANTAVDDTLLALGDLRDARLQMVFKIKDTNPDCLENRILAIRNYLKGENLSKSAIKTVERIISQIRPRYVTGKPVINKTDKTTPPPPRGAGKSPSEKSFGAAVGFAKSIVNTITKLGVDYNPPDANISVASMTTLVEDIEQANKDTQDALEAYGDAHRARLDLYNGSKGLEVRRAAVLNYLSSFPKLKKSDHFIEYNDALKGK